MPDRTTCSAPAQKPGERSTTHHQAVLGDRRGYQVAKRCMDVGVCLLALPVLLPVMALIGLLVRLDSRGPALFVQERVGRAGQPIHIYKFRTMHHNLDNSTHEAYQRAFVSGKVIGSLQEGTVHKPFGRSEATRLSPILRRTSLDELPQMINVLKGEMSLVGPRPNLPWEVEEYQPWHRRRLDVLPGITGLAQVNGRSSLSFDRIVAYDIEYVEHRDLVLDLKILWWTVPVLLSGEGAR